MLDKFRAIEQRYEDLEHLMAQPEVAGDYVRLGALAKERASLEDAVKLFHEYQACQKAIEDAQAMLGENDEELAALAKEELDGLREKEERLRQELRLTLLPQDPRDKKDVIVEIRAGTGGDEAGLFAADLYRMYARYAQRQGWEAEVIDANETGIGGFKEIVFEVRGKGAYSRLKHESGVHRVQRIPTTESSGRIHTSTATVAVLPEAEDVELNINPDDLRIDIYHAGGHGGQNVQKVATAVRITHIPTGIVAICQDERSQLRNKQKAMAVLSARLLDLETRKQQEEITESRRSQVGTAERAEKVRTYNFPQNRVTDHRIGLTLHSLDRLMEGDIDALVDALSQAEQARRLQEASV